jgi:F0F1-type ATP synthase assembly protein I
MPAHRADSGDLSHNSGSTAAHRSPVTRAPATISSVSGAARTGRLFYSTLSASSVGLELGLSVVFGVLFGRWLDGKLGTAPWMMLLFFAIGVTAGFRSVLRAVKRADRAAEAEARRG